MSQVDPLRMLPIPIRDFIVDKLDYQTIINLCRTGHFYQNYCSDPNFWVQILSGRYPLGYDKYIQMGLSSWISPEEVLRIFDSNQLLAVILSPSRRYKVYTSLDPDYEVNGFIAGFLTFGNGDLKLLSRDGRAQDSDIPNGKLHMTMIRNWYYLPDFGGYIDASQAIRIAKARGHQNLVKIGNKYFVDLRPEVLRGLIKVARMLMGNIEIETLM